MNYFVKLFTSEMGLFGACRLPMFKNHVGLFVLNLLLYIAAVKAEIRCYCNQPPCVSKGYMCKSMSGTCFTEVFSSYSDFTKSRHGCVELLSSFKKNKCLYHYGVASSLPAVYCCKEEDMCNYKHAVNIDQRRSNRSQISGFYDLTEERRAYEAAVQQDVWFKAAVIAVPIAGGFILILLILLATRILRKDSKRQRQLLELKRQQTLGNRTQVLFGQPCLNHPNCNLETLVPDSKSTHMHGNTNFSVSRHSWCADATTEGSESQFVYDNEHRNSTNASLLPWTKWNPPKLSTMV